MQKYIIGASDDHCPIILPFDDNGQVGEWQQFGAGIMYKAEEADAALAAKDRDLADAKHMLILANNNAAAFQRVAEQRQGEIERLQRALQKVMARLADLLDEDHFNNIEAVVINAGVPYPPLANLTLPTGSGT